MNTQADLLLSAVGALQDFSNAAIAMGRALAPIISDVGKGFRDLGNAVYWQTGYDAGKNGDERQWTAPDAWHRGYLRGRLYRWKNDKRQAEILYYR